MAGSSIYFTKVGLNSQTFTSNGNFIVPDGVTNVIALLVGGGGGGGGASSSGGSPGGASGGSGAEVIETILNVNPGDNLSVVVGAGGAGGAGALGAGGNGSDGQNTTLTLPSGQQILAKFGLGGIGADSSTSGKDSVLGSGKLNVLISSGPDTFTTIYSGAGCEGGNSGAGANGGTPSLNPGSPGEGTPFNFNGGGAGGAVGGGDGGAGGGGGASWGNGGAGGNGGFGTYVPANHDGKPGSLGGGGGGGGGVDAGVQGGNGGAGGSGFITLYWKKD